MQASSAVVVTADNNAPNVAAAPQEIGADAVVISGGCRRCGRCVESSGSRSDALILA